MINSDFTKRELAIGYANEMQCCCDLDNWQPELSNGEGQMMVDELKSETLALQRFSPNTDGGMEECSLGEYYDTDEVDAAHIAQAAEIARLRDAMSEFCARVERGEVRSKRTYAQFNELLGRTALGEKP